ncbi:hypothetical protein NC651_003293 [Populus alba x Populus x berolinensis]|nr:hypothetical protein NC651_003293 [Populus alba x Populus x berolinensis]
MPGLRDRSDDPAASSGFRMIDVASIGGCMVARFADALTQQAPGPDGLEILGYPREYESVPERIGTVLSFSQTSSKPYPKALDLAAYPSFWSVQ